MEASGVHVAEIHVLWVNWASGSSCHGFSFVAKEPTQFLFQIRLVSKLELGGKQADPSSQLGFCFINKFFWSRLYI